MRIVRACGHLRPSQPEMDRLFAVIDAKRNYNFTVTQAALRGPVVQSR